VQGGDPWVFGDDAALPATRTLTRHCGHLHRITLVRAPSLSRPLTSPADLGLSRARRGGSVILAPWARTSEFYPGPTLPAADEKPGSPLRRGLGCRLLRIIRICLVGGGYHSRCRLNFGVTVVGQVEGR